MSKKSDLLVRVRYLNPLPNPPFPPKLLNVSTDINRLGEPSYLDPLAASTPLPMLVDSEMGMPLDLNAYDGVWEGKEESLNPQLDAGRVHHPIDVALLAPFNAPPAINGDAKPALTTDVSWMRNSSYLTRKNNAKRREAAESRAEAVVDASEAAQLMAIDKSFSDIHAQEAKDIRHPDSKKKALRVVESYDILPDDDSWPNSYMIIRFPERPTAATALNPAAGASSPRLAKAIMRPVVDDEQQMMEFYLPQEEHLAKLDDAYERAVDKEPLENILALSAEDPLDPKIDEVFPNAVYDRIRTYEVVSANPPSKEVLVAFQEDDEETDRPNKRRKGVYYKQITFRTLLRKTRAKRRGEVETRGDLWDKTRVGFRIPEEREVEDRQTARGQVQDPTWASAELRRLHGGDNMAEGQGEAIDDEELVDEGAQQAEAALDDVDED
nr:uncharacterized protein CI109_004534 [Kwoniella shandongensis]KAA5526999.1 hypothetical protein CI109_004534 [Kwoniella shandongensis]